MSHQKTTKEDSDSDLEELNTRDLWTFTSDLIQKHPPEVADEQDQCSYVAEPVQAEKPSQETEQKKNKIVGQKAKMQVKKKAQGRPISGQFLL